MFALLLTMNTVYGDSATALDIVKETTREVLTRVQAEKSRLLLYPDYIEIIVKDLIVPHFDFTEMSLLVLDKDWQKLNKSEQACFTTGFRNLLIGRYADIFLSYTEQKISYEPVKEIGEKNYVSVRQKISHTGIGPFYVDYRMKPESSGWKVVDLVVDDVSLLKSYRLDYRHKIHRYGLDSLIMEFQECKKIKN